MNPVRQTNDNPQTKERMTMKTATKLESVAFISLDAVRFNAQRFSFIHTTYSRLMSTFVRLW